MEEPPKDGKYTFVEKSYEDDEDHEDDDHGGKGKSNVKSELDIATQRLMELIFKYVYPLLI